MPSLQDVRFWRDPDLHGLEIRYSRYREISFPRHAHETYSVGVVLAGSTRLWARGLERRVIEGDLALFAPGEVHSCNPEQANWAYYMFHVQPEWLEGLAADMAGITNGRVDRIIFPSSVVRDAELAESLQRLAALVTEQGELLERQELATEVFGWLLARHGEVRRAGGETQGDPEAVRRAREALESNLSEKLTLDELARRAALSPYHLLRVFRESTGLPPHAWRTQRRISHARALLAGGAPLAQAAVEAGFTDQSHFSKAFKQYVGVTPGGYRREGSSESNF
ncbi:MAG: helix-turn-helix domain-containing protein [Desulfovibrio sp.]